MRLKMVFPMRKRASSTVSDGSSARCSPRERVTAGALSPLSVAEAWFTLPNLDNVAVRIADVAARLPNLVHRLRDKLRSSSSPEFITALNIRNTNIQEAADQIRFGGDAERYRRLVRVGPPPTLIMSQVLAI